MVLSTDALFHCLGSSGVGAEINEVEGGLKCPKHSGGLIETSPGTRRRGREGGEAVQGATAGDPHHLSMGDDE